MLYLNGNFVERSEAKVDIEDRGFQFADGLYEVILVRRGRPFWLSEHLARFDRNAELIHLATPPDRADWPAVIDRLIAEEGLENGIVYLQVTRGAASREHWSSAVKEPTVVIYLKPLADNRENLERGIRTVSVPDERWGWCHIKSIGLLPNVLAKEAAYRAGAKEAIFHRSGIVTEGGSSNVAIVRNGTVLTHPADHLILDGITRQQVLGICRRENIPVEERPFSLEEMLTADEAFITSTTSHVTPVISLDGREIADGRPGGLTLRLQRAYLALLGD